MLKGIVHRVSGPVVIADNMRGVSVYEVVEVGQEKLIGEVIGVEGDRAIIQVYEDTGGLQVGEPVVAMGKPLSAELAPGLIGSIFDGIQRPLPELNLAIGFFIKKGVKLPAIPRDKKWYFTPTVKA
ncbi:MAG: V-type ATP synthase subunit A, partial [Desulfurococcaceae archaeon]